MGMFDWITCDPSLGPRGKQYQTRCTPAQFMDMYQIRQDGTLWHEAYDIEDRSDPNAEGLAALEGMLTRVNKRWELVSAFTGEIAFYDDLAQYSAYFINGKLQSITEIK